MWIGCSFRRLAAPAAATSHWLPLTWLCIGPMNACMAGQHTLTITKISDSKKGVAWLQSIELDPTGSFLPPPPTPGMRSGRRMLFLGDSFT